MLKYPRPLNNSTFAVCCIEEPETCLHPKLQKEIPVYFNNLIKKYPNLQLFVSTHSPFIISASAKYAYVDDSLNNGQKILNQKTYFIENGRTCHYSRGQIEVGIDDENGDEYVYGSNGFFGPLVIGPAAKILGAGWEDVTYHPISSTIPTIKTNIIIFCESSNSNVNDLDETIYNIIFKSYVHQSKRINFISCGSCNNVIENTIMYNQLSKSNFVTTSEYIGLIDKDHHNDMIVRCPELRILARYNIESYLYDPLVIEKLGIQNFNVGKYKNFFDDIDMVRENVGHSNSNCLKDYIHEHYNQYVVSKSALAQIIFDNMGGDLAPIYNELKSCIFPN